MMSPCGICSPTIELGAGWWYYRFQFGHGTPLYLSICVSIFIHAHTGHHNTVTSHERHGVSNHRWLKSLSKRNQPVTGEFPTQRGSVAEIWCFLWKFDVSPNKLPIKHKRDQTQERQVNWHTHFDGLVQDCSIPSAFHGTGIHSDSFCLLIPLARPPPKFSSPRARRFHVFNKRLTIACIFELNIMERRIWTSKTFLCNFVFTT